MGIIPSLLLSHWPQRCWLLLAVFVVATTSGACGPAPAVMLRLSGTPRDALVTIDDRYIDKLGRISKRGIKLRPGHYRLTVEQVGFFPHDQIVHIEAERPRALNIELQAIPQ